MKNKYNKLRFPEAKKIELLWLFSIIFLTELIGGIYFNYMKGILLNDAFSRTANAFYVLFIKPMRLASIGLVWNPLPSILQLPFVACAKFWRPMVSYGISAVIVTSICAALAGVILYRTFTRFSIPKKYCLPIIVLYITNPFIFFYGMNGMSESIMFLIIIYIVLNITLWMVEGSPEYIIKIGFGLLVAFYCRYEAIPFAFAVGVGVLINIFFNKNEKQFIPVNNKKEIYHYAEGTAIVLYAPIIYGILIWIFLNWTIAGSPLYFLNSPYSNTVQSELIATSRSGVAILGYVLGKLYPFLPLFLGIIVVRIIGKKLIKFDFFILLNLAIWLIVFHYLMLLKGTSYGWLRFFSYIYPICAAWLPYELYKIKSKGFKTIILGIILISMAASSILTGITLSDPNKSPEEHDVVIDRQAGEIADYINEEIPDNKVMMDSFVTSGIILNVKNIDNLVVSSNLNFDKYVSDPDKYGINDIVVPDPNGIGALDAINRKYPHLYEDGEDWCTLKEEFENYKIFEIKD